MISISLSTFVPVVIGLAITLAIAIYFKTKENDLRGGLLLGSVAGGLILISSMAVWKAREHRLERNSVAEAEMVVREEKQELLARGIRERQVKERAEIKVSRTALIESLSLVWERLRLLPTPGRNGDANSNERVERALLIDAFLNQHGDSLPKLTMEQYGVFPADIRKVIMSYIDFGGVPQ